MVCRTIPPRWCRRRCSPGWLASRFSCVRPACLTRRFRGGAVAGTGVVAHGGGAAPHGPEYRSTRAETRRRAGCGRCAGARRRCVDRLGPRQSAGDRASGAVALARTRAAGCRRHRRGGETAAGDGQRGALRLRGGAGPAERRNRCRCHQLLSIGWYAGWGDAAVLSASQRSLRAGERWRFTLRLRKPHGNLNPHGFDHELNLFERGVGATGYVRDGPDAPRLLGTSAAHPIERLRQRVRDSIREAVANPRAAGVLAALAIGDQSAIDRDDWQIFRDSGIAHLVAISGLHVTMFAWLAAALIGRGWRRCGSASAASAGTAGGALRRGGCGCGLCARRRMGRSGTAHGPDAARRWCCSAASGAAGPGRWC